MRTRIYLCTPLFTHTFKAKRPFDAPPNISLRLRCFCDGCDAERASARRNDGLLKS
jgi:hypothetical protein